jgi:DNA-binding LytR/AlgR family response regulator
MTALLIEDEIPAGKRLERLLLENGFIVLKQVYSIKNAVHWLKENNPPDYIFMDIELADGNCFAVFDKVEITSKVIFTTAYDEYALKAFEYNALDYLLKPIDEEKLKKMLVKVKSFKNSVLSELDILKEKSNSNVRTSFLVVTSKGLKKIGTEDIIGFTSENNATFLITNTNIQYHIQSSLEKLESELDAATFFRINRKYIVNKNFIVEINSDNELLTYSTPQLSLKISRLKRKAFLEWFER